MALDPNQWRSDAAYAYLDDLDAEGLAWECLRRNTGYQDEYAAAQIGKIDGDAVDDLIRRHWGLRFRDESGPHCTRRNHLLVAGNRHCDGYVGRNIPDYRYGCRAIDLTRSFVGSLSP